MARLKKEKVAPVEATEKAHEMYEGFNIEWLRTQPSHRYFYLVAEYDKKFKK